MVEISGALNVIACSLMKIANDIRFLGESIFYIICMNRNNTYFCCLEGNVACLPSVLCVLYMVGYRTGYYRKGFVLYNNLFSRQD
jgi:hypothetical protein